MRSALWLAPSILLAAQAAQGAGLRANVDRNEAEVGERIVLTLAVEGSASAEPELPDLSPFDVYSRGQSTQVQIVNGRMSTTVAHTYILVPKRTGTFTIGPASVAVEGQTYTSAPVTVRVRKAGQAPAGDSRDVFATATVSNDHPYVGEQVIYTMRFLQRVQTQRVTLETQEFDGFVVQDLGDQRAYDTTVKGVQYRVTELRKALFAQEPGPLTVPAATLNAEVVMRGQRRRRGLFGDIFDDGFFNPQTRSRIVRAAPVEIQVLPLPPAPSGFAGLVGDFDIQARLSRPTAAVGESTTLTIEVSGAGNAQRITEPALGELAGFKVYDDKPTSNLTTRKDGVWGSKTFRKALVPLQEGELTIPAITLTVFDPKARLYRTRTSRTLRFTATPSTGSEELRLTELVTPTTGKVAVKILADDILPIYRRVDALSSHGFAGPTRLAYGGGLLLPALGFVGLFLFRRRRERLVGDTAYRRRSRAARRAGKTLADVAAHEKAGRRLEAAEAASRALRELVGDLLNIEGAALTHGDVAEHLLGSGVDEALAGRVAAVLTACEAAQYGGATSSAELEGLAGRVKQLIKDLERALGA